MNIATKFATGAGRVIVAAVCAMATGGVFAQADCLAEATPVQSIDMRVLVISADGNESVLPAIRNTLEYSGIPYDLIRAKDIPLTADLLCSAADGQGHARYQGVLLTSGNLPFEESPGVSVSAFTLDEWNLLWRYEAKYGVRQATLYTFPGGWPDTFGLNPPSGGVNTTTSPLSTTLTSSSPAGSGDASGRDVFSYLQRQAPVVIRNAWTYLATPAANANVTPLLVDGAGNAIVSINNYADGRKNLAVTADGNASLIHTLSLGPGIVNWVTKGLHVGERRIYLSAQPDDMLLGNVIWDPAANSAATGKTYRMTADDYRKFMAWQNYHNDNNRGYIVMEIPFNAFGATPAYPQDKLFPATSDDLTPAIQQNNEPFYWVSHTFSHLNLDNLSYSVMLDELRQNHVAARNTLKFDSYHKDALVTPEITGLNNAEALRAMSDFGIRYLVSDSSKHCGNRDSTPGQPCSQPRPNTGIYNDLQPDILMVPRYPTNLYFNVCTPTEWAAEYNFIYRSFWGRDLSYAEILDKESEVWLRYMLNGDIRPLMFHQSNMCAYDGNRSLLGDLIDATTDKYNAIFKLPPKSRKLRQIGKLMADRMLLNDALAPASGPALSARILPGATSSSIELINPTPNAITVPITGVEWGGADRTSNYGGQPGSRVVVNANGGTVTVPGAPAW